MLALQPPPGWDDKAKVVSLCKKAPWQPHKATWLAAYDAYEANRGDPHKLAPAVFTPDVATAQRALYETRKRNGPIRRIRDRPGLSCCPMCGSGTTGHVDHHLGQAAYPEFSVFSRNLVPACSHCNSGEKGGLVAGAPPHERFIHPYYDKLADTAIWLVRFGPRSDAMTFTPEPLPGLSAEVATRVHFHLGHVLGRQFQLTAANRWSSLPALIRKRARGGPVSTTSVAQAAKDFCSEAEISNGLNSWEAAFFRGLTENDAHHAWIRDRALTSVGGLQSVR